MKTHISYLFFFCVSYLFFQTSSSNAQVIFPEPLSERIANYDIDVKLNAATKILDGKEILYWRNTSNDTIYDLQFHLYLNAFKNTESTFLQSGRIGTRGADLFGEGDDIWGWTEVTSMKMGNDIDLTPQIEFYQPDDDNDKDQTVIRVPLVDSLAIMPGDTIQLEIDFQAKLPQIMARTGFSRDYFFVAQWFPKIGVYEAPGQRYATEGQWNCHQFHGNTEFFADFGVYNVRMTVPENMIVGATGVLQEEKENADSTKTYYYRAEDVIDFAWTASPNFLEFTDEWEHVKVRLLIHPEHENMAPRYLESAIKTIEYFDKHVGKYPYPNLTIIDPPSFGAASGGMEYPTFITGISFSFLPEGVRSVEGVTAHEFAHQYFMQLIASNEFEEAWLDEGFTTYMENRALDATYGKKNAEIDFMGIQMGNRESRRAGYVGMENPKIAENFRPGWEFKHGGYGTITYNKTATWLSTLEGIVGLETMDQIMQTYFERWKFKHPCARDFIEIVNEVTGEDMQWFFDQVLYSAEICDYKIHRVYNGKVEKEAGIFGLGEERELIVEDEEEEDNSNEENKKYESKVIIHRIGEVKMPMEILVHFEDGEEVLEKWDGQARTYELKYERPEKIKWAQIDPEYKIYMDVNFNNNSYTTEPDAAPAYKYTSRFVFWVQQLMQTIASLV